MLPHLPSPGAKAGKDRGLLGPNFDTVLQALRNEGCAVHAQIKKSQYGRLRWVVDPEGNKIKLSEPPPLGRVPE